MSGLEDLLTGRTLVKRYRIQEVIGRGGFAAVYRADDERLGRPVAVKVISLAAQDAAAGERHRERFEREARAAASLPQHPNVVTVHDFGVDPVLGLDFLVMEFLHGEDLATRLRREGRPPLEEALRILGEAAAGIAVGHRAGIVHRDVKPGNIFLARGGTGDPLRVCILDFGIARVLTDDQTVTRVPGEGMPLSPAYASPEQSRGAAEIGSASDVFSLGVVGYQLLTGEKPFQPQRGSDPAEWVPARSIRAVSPQVPAAVEAVILRALAHSPEERFADAEDFATALASAMAGDETRVVLPTDTGAARGGAAGTGEEEELDRTLFQPPPDRTLYQEAPRPPTAAEPRVLHVPRTTRRRGGGGMLLLVLLFVAVGLGAGWWLLGGREGRPALDEDAAADVETISEGFGEENREAGPADEGLPAASGSAAREPAPVVPPEGGTGAEPPPLPSAMDSVSGQQTAASDSATPPNPGSAADRDSGAAPIDTTTPPTDSAPPPPRVIGAPVDSIASSPTPSVPSGGRLPEDVRPPAAPDLPAPAS